MVNFVPQFRRHEHWSGCISPKDNELVLGRKRKGNRCQIQI